MSVYINQNEKSEMIYTMNDIQLIGYAEKFLNSKNIAFFKPGEIARRNSERVEIVFLIPETLDPDVVIDPSDVRILVDIKTGYAELIPQM